MRLEIAAGANPQKTGSDWLRHDFRELSGIDIVCDWRGIYHRLWTLLNEIYCRHFIEHLSQDEGIEFLEMCFKCLQPGGTVTIICPNMRWLCVKYLRRFYSDPSEFVCWMYGGGDSEDWSYHKSGYDAPLLCRALRTVGFEIVSADSQEFLLEVKGVKPR